MIVQRDNVRKVLTIVVMFILLVLLGTSHAMAATVLEDGEYTINYEILRGDNKDDSTSLADGYWNKPAKVFVKDGNITVQTTINQHAWVAAFATQYNGKMVDAKVVSTNEKANSRVTEFKVNSFDEMLLSSMTVEIPEMDYFHSYEVRFKFNLDSLKSVVKATPTPDPTVTTKPSATPTPTKETSNTITTKPSTSDKPKAPTETVATPTPDNSGSSTVKPDTSPSTSTNTESSKVEEKGEVTEIGIDLNEEVSLEADAEVLTETLADDVVVVTEEGITANEAGDQVAEVETEQFTVDVEAKQGGTVAITIIIIIAIIFIAAVTAWIVISRKRNN